MNRIILIGNGFDRAHNLPTRYKDFIDDFWRREIEKIRERDTVDSYEDEYIYLKSYDSMGMVRLMDDASISSLSDLEERIELLKPSMSNRIAELKIKNKFLEYISRASDDDNWVDIENEYHRFLCSLMNLNKNLLKQEKLDLLQSITVKAGYQYRSVEKLNTDFAQIKRELEAYLIRVQEENQLAKVEEIEGKIYSKFAVRDFTSKGLGTIVDEEYYKVSADIEAGEPYKAARLYDSSYPYMKEGIKDLIKWGLLNEENIEDYDLLPQELLFLNFNYTNLEKLYIDEDLEMNQEVIHIHGELDTPDNPIIFGYGDEIGEEYAQLEKLGDNHYLENIKSIRYLEADSYKRLLNFIESGEYQIFIFGHSCGNSDRTLLNTLFEHDNCVSVKVYYHQESEKEDNFSDVIRNISRNFNNKASMREKVVNKNYSEPLRQIK